MSEARILPKNFKTEEEALNWYDSHSEYFKSEEEAFAWLDSIKFGEIEPKPKAEEVEAVYSSWFGEVENQFIKPIKYSRCIEVRKGDKAAIKEIKWEDIDSYNFTKGFIEILDNPEYVHLYFDFDSIKTEEEFISVRDWLKSLESIFGKFSYGGYSNNKHIAEEFEFKYIEGEKHVISMHAVFYETRISSDDLITIMKQENGSYIAKGLHKLCDPNVYKLKSNQKFRHVLSDKIYHSGSEKNEAKAGIIANNLKPSTQIVQTKGTELIITKEKWSKLFHIKENSKNEELEVSKMNDLNYSNKLIFLSKEELLELLNYFPPEHDMLSTKANCLFQSPYDKDFLLEVLNEWYFRRNHTNAKTVESYLNKYYKKTNTNKWFYTLIKYLPEEKKLEVIERNQYEAIDTEAKIDMTEKFGLPELRRTDYRYKGGVGININRFISDLMKCVVVINSAKQLFIIKDYDEINNTNKLSFLKDEDFTKLMKSINLGSYYKEGKLKKVTAWNVYDEGKNKNWLMKDGIRFYDERPNIFSFFTGYEAKLLNSINNDAIQLFLDHIREVICDENEELYEYILNWYSLILQNPGKKTEIALVLTGKQGTGKNVFTNILCDLMKKYSNRNLTNIDHIVGKFNASIENKALIICNELSSAESNKYLNSDALKSIITERTIEINQKNMPVRTAENVSNLILVSNDFIPIKIEQGDRRYVIAEVSNKFKGDFDYFEKLCNSFEKNDFYDNLFTFFMTRDLSKFNPRRIPMTKAKEEILNLTKSAYQLFFEENIAKFNECWRCSDCYESYRGFAQLNGFQVSSSITFGKNIREFCDRIRITDKILGGRPWVYKTKEGINLDDDDDDQVGSS